jgi:hypothetical protein
MTAARIRTAVNTTSLGSQRRMWVTTGQQHYHGQTKPSQALHPHRHTATTLVEMSMKMPGITSR